jgi:hypothetical protein
MSKLHNGFSSSLTEGAKGYLYSVFVFVVLLRNGISAKNLLLTSGLNFIFAKSNSDKEKGFIILTPNIKIS